MGVVVVGVLGQGLTERLVGAVGIPREEQRAPVVRAERGQHRVQLEGAGQLLDGLGHVAGGEGRRAENEESLGRVPALQQAAHEGLALLHFSVAGQGHAQQVEHRPVVRVGGGRRSEQLLDRVELAEAEPAVGEEQGEPQLVRLRLAQHLELLGRARHVARLVVGEGQVVPDAGVGYDLEGGPVGLDGLLVAPQRRQGGPEVRARGGVAALEGEDLVVGGHRGLEVPRLVQRHGALVGLADVCGRARRERRQREQGGEQKRGEDVDAQPRRHVRRG